MRPKSSSSTLMSRSAGARIVPSSIGTSYVRPVRLSVMLSVSDAAAGREVLVAADPDRRDHEREHGQQDAGDVEERLRGLLAAFGGGGEQVEHGRQATACTAIRSRPPGPGSASRA